MDSLLDVLQRFLSNLQTSITAYVTKEIKDDRDATTPYFSDTKIVFPKQNESNDNSWGVLWV